MEKESFFQLIKALKLDTGWFSDVPLDLYYLAISRKVQPQVKTKILEKYKTVSHQTLEFFGDRVINLIASTAVYRIYGLEARPIDLHKLYTALTNNFFLTTVVEKQNQACSLIKRATMCQEETTSSLEKHNICGDSLEAIFGALYLYSLENHIHQTDNPLRDIANLFFSYNHVIDTLAVMFEKNPQDIVNFLKLEYPPVIDWDIKLLDIEHSPNYWKVCQPIKEVKSQPRSWAEVASTPRLSTLQSTFVEGKSLKESRPNSITSFWLPVNSPDRYILDEQQVNPILYQLKILQHYDLSIIYGKKRVSIIATPKSGGISLAGQGNDIASAIDDIFTNKKTIF